MSEWTYIACIAAAVCPAAMALFVCAASGLANSWRVRP
jgi:hypothetical protein